MRHWSLRARVTAVATLAVAVTLVLVGFVAVRSIRQGLTSRVDAQLEADAQLVTARSLDGRRIPAGAIANRIAEVVDADGSLVWASEPAGGDSASPLLDPIPFEVGSGDHHLSIDDPALGELRILVTPFGADDEQWLVVARSEEQALAAARSILRGSLLVVPLLTAGVALIVWMGVGRALRPVEAIRTTVGEISDRHLSTRVPVPDSGDEIERLAVTMNDMLDRLDAAAGRERQLVADASHELRSPLASVRVLLETRASSPDPATHDAQAMTAVLRLQAIVEQLLALAEQDVGQAPPPRPVDLDDLVLERASELRASTAIQVDTTAVSGGQVLGSEEGLRRLVDNLMGNSARHARSTIRIEVREIEGWVQLVVADDGPGIPEPDRVAVFERFVRLDEGRSTDRSGAGLGLAIVAGVVGHHHGTVSIDDDPQLGGARFVVNIPAAPTVSA